MSDNYMLAKMMPKKWHLVDIKFDSGGVMPANVCPLLGFKKNLFMRIIYDLHNEKLVPFV